MSADPDPFEIADSPGGGQFDLRDGDRLVGLARYAVVPGQGGEPDRVVFFHTEVRREYEGQGLAGRLASAALDAVVASGRTIVPVCPYITGFLKRHAEAYAAHVSPATPADLAAVDAAIDG